MIVEFATGLDLFAAALLVVVGILYARNVRALHSARNALAESKEKISFILHSSGVGIWSWNVAADSVTADRTCSLLFGLTPGEFPRDLAGFSRLVHPEDLPGLQESLRKTLETGAEYKITFRVMWADTTVRWLATRARVYSDASGKPEHLTGVSWDITEPRKASDDVRIAHERLKQSLAELDRQGRENALLAEMTDLLQSCGTSAEAHEIIGQFCRQLFPDLAGALFIFSASRNLLQSVASWNEPALPAPGFGPDDCWAMRRGHPHYVEGARFAASCRHLAGVARYGHACIPMMAQGTGIGILYFQSRNGDGNAPLLSEAQRQLSAVLARQLALSLANLGLRDALRSQTIRDPLTGLFNRRYLEDSLERELARLTRRQQPVGLLMLDLDHFKRFNDTYGHEAGDAVLRSFGQFLKERIRKEDIACRYGGEEFCVVLAESALENTVRRCEQLSAEVKRMMVQHAGALLPPVTISVGIAQYPGHGQETATLISAADRALYEAKAAGRDRIVVASAPGEKELAAP